VASKLKTLSELSRWSKRAQAQGRKIVATNGCFDLIHFGHVDYLQRARKLGDLLIVGLNSDRSVRALKGAPRPLMVQRHRAAVLAALACVDAIVIFPDKRATRFLRAARPSVYVKGGDYRPETLDRSERTVLEQMGTRIRLLPLIKGCSTTRLIRKIKESVI
jgi:rfaE bifunctional protein nucleotidyltransferase chain/domain